MSQDGPGAISPRFASVSSDVSPSPMSVSPERAAEITSKCERASAQAQSHFENHRQMWTNRQYGELLACDGSRMTLRPRGMPDDRKAHLMRAADSMVLHRQAKRLVNIERAAANMLGGSARDSKQDIGR